MHRSAVPNRAANSRSPAIRSPFRRSGLCYPKARWPTRTFSEPVLTGQGYGIYPRTDVETPFIGGSETRAHSVLCHACWSARHGRLPSVFGVTGRFEGLRASFRLRSPKKPAISVHDTPG